MSKHGSYAQNGTRVCTFISLTFPTANAPFELANARKCLRFVLGRNSLYCKIRSFRLCIYYIYIDWKELFIFLRAIYVSAVRTAGYRPLRDQSECSILADGPLRNTGHKINICYSPMYIILKSEA